jgi:hypothetical protein
MTRWLAASMMMVGLVTPTLAPAGGVMGGVSDPVWIARGHGGRGGGGGGGGVSSPGPSAQAAEPSRGEPSGVLWTPPIQIQIQRAQQPQPLTGPPVPPAVVQWEGGATVAVPITIRLGLGQAVASVSQPATTTLAPTYMPSEQLTAPAGTVQACNAAGQCVPCPCTLKY